MQARAPGCLAAARADGDKRRWLGSFPTAKDAGLAYDAAAIIQKGTKAKTNFAYEDYETNPRNVSQGRGCVSRIRVKDSCQGFVSRMRTTLLTQSK